MASQRAAQLPNWLVISLFRKGKNTVPGVGKILAIVPRVVNSILTRTFHTRVAADVSRRHLGGGQNAPADVGGYAVGESRGVGSRPEKQRLEELGGRLVKVDGV